MKKLIEDYQAAFKACEADASAENQKAVEASLEAIRACDTNATEAAEEAPKE